jgi:hypothetical protein
MMLLAATAITVGWIALSTLLGTVIGAVIHEREAHR